MQILEEEQSRQKGYQTQSVRIGLGCFSNKKEPNLA